MHWMLATSNQGKGREFSEHFKPFSEIKLSMQSAFNVPSVPEPADTFLENALIKARHGCQWAGMPVIADDSGLVVPALSGQPGVHSSRYAGQDADDASNTQKLLDAMAHLEGCDREAHFYCALVFLRHAGDPVPLVSFGQWSGTIMREPQGCGGFGYDPVFFVAKQGCSAALLPVKLKNSLSHRGAAIKALVHDMRQLGILNQFSNNPTIS